MTSIFLSYARGDDEPFVERLYHALQKRGFDVWWDRVCMPSRLLTFHQEIREAIAARERLVLVVGPRAVASDYVRQEWKFAINEDKVVTPILRLGDYPLVPDELRLFHHEDFRDDGRFDFHLDNLARQLSEPPPPLGKLIAVPSLPAHYLARAERLNALRDTLRADLDRPVVIGGASARVGVHGMGGIGKSVLAAALARDRKVREAFPDGIVWIGLGSLPDVPALQRRAHRDLGGDGAFETEHQGKGRLKELLADRAVLLILDDVWRRADVDWFDVLGPRCRALVTTRDTGLLTALGGVHHVLELLTDRESLDLLALAAGVPRDALPGETAPIVAECGRLPLAVGLCGGMIRRGLPWSGVLQQLQQARIDRIADRHAVEKHHESVWHAIHVSVEFLPAHERQRFVELAVFPPDEPAPEAAIGTLWAHTGGLDEWAAQELLVTLGERSLVQLVTSTSDSGQPLRRSASLHDLVYDYVQRSVHDARALQGQLLAAYQAKCKDGWPSGPDDGYFFTHLRRHLIAAGRAGELADLLHELRWLQAKNEAGLTFDLTSDFREALGRLSPEDSRLEILRLLDETLRGDIHFIARHFHDYPQALFQCFWNRGWWYDCPEVRAHCEVPAPSDPPDFEEELEALMRGEDLKDESGAAAEAALATPPPWNRPGPKLHELLEAWRRQKETEPNFQWVRSLRPPALPSGSSQLVVLRGHEKQIKSVAWSPDGRQILSASEDETVRLSDANSGQELTCLRGFCCAAWSPDGRRIALGAADTTVRVWDGQNGGELLCLAPREGSVSSVVFSPDGLRVSSVSSGGAVRVWNARSGAELLRLSARTYNGAREFVVSPNGVYLAGFSHDEARVWDVGSGKELLYVQHSGFYDQITCVAFSPDSLRLATGSTTLSSGKNFGTVRLWDIAARSELSLGERYSAWDKFWRTLRKTPESGVGSLGFSPDGTRLAIGLWDLTIRFWDVVRGGPAGWLRDPAGGALLTFSPDGLRLAVSGSGTARVWDVQGNQERPRLRGHVRGIECITFSPNGLLCASGSRDGLRIWGALKGTEVACLGSADYGFIEVKFLSDGQHVVSEESDEAGMGMGYLGLWNIASGKNVKTLPLWTEEEGYVGAWSQVGPLAELSPDAGPWRAVVRSLETVIESKATGGAAARFPVGLTLLSSHPSGCIWAGARHDHLYLIVLEGGDERSR